MFFKTRRSLGIRVTPRVHNLIRQADILQIAGDYTGAVTKYQLVVRDYPSLAHIWMQLANSAAQAGMIDTALEAYSKAEQLQPNSVEPIRFSARLHAKVGDLARAEQQYRKIVTMLSTDDEAEAAIERLLSCRLAAPRVAPIFQIAAKPERYPVLPDDHTVADVQILLDGFYFHHGIDFGDGLASRSPASVNFVEQTAEAFFGALDLSSRSLLDVGAWTGAYSFEAKKRGAARVVASDHYVWNDPGFRGRQAFDLAHSLTGLDIEPVDIDLPDISIEALGRFDLVLFAGVFYHLQEPVGATRQVSTCAEHLLILETHQDALDNARPAMIYYPGAELNDDVTNWWGPNPHFVYEMLTSFGFEDIWYCDAPGSSMRGIFHAFRNVESRRLLGWDASGPSLSLSDPGNRALIFRPTALEL